MSDKIVCHECHSENAPGSKFCNNCGTPLGDSSERICPVCQTPNPRNRYYCDECGTRLIRDDFAEETEASDVPDPSSGGDVFSLPTREPGDTGELDPSDLPEWLRTGTAPLAPDEAESGQVTGSGKLPNIEDLTPEKKRTADLPEWLVSEHDSEPIIEPPVSISTDHYLALVGSRESDDVDSGDEDIEATGAELPAWLIDSADSPEADVSGEDQAEAESAGTESVAPGDQPDTSAASPEDADELPSPLPEAQLPDWLAELGPLNTDILSSPIDEELSVPSEVSLSDEELPDWIDELGPPDTTMLSEPIKKLTGLIDKGTTGALEDVDDWLADFDADAIDTQMLSLAADESYDQEDSSPDEAAAEAELPPQEPEEPAALEELPPWPDVSDVAQDEQVSPLELGDSTAIDEIDFEDSDAFAAWLDESDVSGDEPGFPLDTGDPTAADEISVEDSDAIPAWLDSSAVSAPAGEAEPPDLHERADFPEWIVEAEDSYPAEEERGETTVDSESQPAEGDVALPAWLLEDSDESSVAAIDADTGIAELAEDEFDSEEPVEATVDLSQWVADLDLPKVDILPDADQEDEVAEDLSLSDDELAGWMDELDPAGTGFLATGSRKDMGDAEVLPHAVDEASAKSLETTAAEPDMPISDELDDVGLPERPVDEIDSEEVASWLADLDTDHPAEEVGERGELVAALFQTDELTDAPELDWLSTAEETAPVEESFRVDLPPEEELVQHEDGFEETDGAILADVPDWLSELGAIDAETSGAIEAITPSSEMERPPEEEEATAIIGDELADLDAELVQEEGISSPAPEISAELPEEVWLGGDAVLDELPEEEELPDWLDQLGPPIPGEALESPVPDELASSEELPDWIASLKPGTDSDAGSLLPTPLAFSPEDEAAFEDIAEELGAPELPDWLREESGALGRADRSVATSADVRESTGWFGPDEADAIDDVFSFDSDSDIPADSEWSHVLSELPPAVPPEDLLIRADIPEWVQQLKPKEDSDAVPEAVPARPAATSGPLAGLAGVISLENLVTTPHVASTATKFSVTREQQQEAALLRRITQWEPRPAILVSARAKVTPWTIRLLLSLLLVGAILAGYYFPDLLPTEQAAPSPGALAVAEVVSDTAGSPVLLAIEFTPGFAGELSAQLKTMLSQFRTNSSPVVLVSQYTAGVGIVGLEEEDVGETIAHFIPGDAVGLRRLAECINSETGCPNVFGRALEPDLQEKLRDVSLVVVLTGDRDSLVNWIEQVGATSDAKMVAGVTQSLSPVASSYQNSGQLAGLIEGKPGLISLQNAMDQSDANGAIQQQLSAQRLSLLIVAVLLSAGAVIFGFADRNLTKKDKVSSVA